MNDSAWPRSIDSSDPAAGLAARRGAVAELGAALRELADVAVGTEVSDDELAAVAAAARGLTRRLSTQQRGPDESARVDAGDGHPLYNPVSGEGSPLAPMLTVDGMPDGRTRGRVTVGRAYEGFPGLVHGGLLATLFDSVLANAAARALERAGMTATLTVRYRRPVRLGASLQITAEVLQREGRRVSVRAALVAENEPGTVLAEAEGLFVVPRAALRPAGAGGAGQAPRPAPPFRQGMPPSTRSVAPLV